MSQEINDTEEEEEEEIRRFTDVLTFHVTPTDKEAIVDFSYIRRQNLSEMLRQAVDEFIENYDDDYYVEIDGIQVKTGGANDDNE